MPIENPQFFAFMFKLISTANRMTMKRLIYNGYISYNQLKYGVVKLFYDLYHTPIDCRIFSHVLNSYLACYLQRVIDEYHPLTSSIPNHTDYRNLISIPPYGYIFWTMPLKVENNSVLSENNVSTAKSTDGLLDSNLQLSDKKKLDNQKVGECSMPCEVPTDVNANTICDASLLPVEKNIDNKQLAVSDLQSFLVPLQQDYTKSSKGYCENKYCKSEFEKAANLLSNNNFQNTEEPVDDNNFNTSDDEYYDPAQNLIISRYLKSLNSSSDESEISCKEICYDSDSDDSIVFSDNVVENTQEKVVSDKYESNNRRKIQVAATFGHDSDSEDSFEFLELFDSKCHANKYGSDTRRKIEVDASFGLDSDSEDSIEFSEIFDCKCHRKSSKTNLENTYENDLYSGAFNSDLFERCDNSFSFSLYQKFNASFKNNDEFSVSSFSLSQDKMTVYSTDIGGFSNPCFEDDYVSSHVNLKSINDKWENSMQNISCEPRQPKRVSFVPLPDLVSVQLFEPDEDNYRYSVFVLDQIRFKNRIQEFEENIKPYLSPSHRAKVYQKLTIFNCV